MSIRSSAHIQRNVEILNRNIRVTVLNIWGTFDVAENNRHFERSCSLERRTPAQRKWKKFYQFKLVLIKHEYMEQFNYTVH